MLCLVVMKCIYDVITCGYLGVINKTNVYFFIRHPNHTDLIDLYMLLKYEKMRHTSLQSRALLIHDLLPEWYM